MTKSAYSDWDTTAANNTDVGGIDIGEGTMLISKVNDVFREIMSQLATAGLVSASGLASGAVTFLTTPSSANLRALVTDESGSGALLFASGAIGTPASGTLTNCTGLPIATGVSGLGTGVATFLATPSSANLRSAMTDESGSGALLFAGGALGAATATSINKVALTAPATSATLTLADGKTLTVDNSIELAGTDSTKMTFPGSSASIAALDLTGQAVTGGARVTSSSLGTISSGTVTLDPGTCPLQHYTNNGAHTLAPGSNGGSILLDITNGASAGAITTSGWTKVVGSFDTSSGHKFRCHASVGNGGSLLTIQALQ